jgi:hypothetical protein
MEKDTITDLCRRLEDLAGKPLPDIPREEMDNRKP